MNARTKRGHINVIVNCSHNSFPCGGNRSGCSQFGAQGGVTWVNENHASGMVENTFFNIQHMTRSPLPHAQIYSSMKRYDRI